ASHRRRPRARRRRGLRRRPGAASRASAGFRRAAARPRGRLGGLRVATLRTRASGQSALLHQSLWMGPASWTLTWKYEANTCAAEGAAASPPCPPFSITAHTTSVAASDGPYPHHQDWFCRPLYPGSDTTFSAVPVLPEIETGNFPNTAYEVPTGMCVASHSPF